MRRTTHIHTCNTCNGTGRLTINHRAVPGWLPAAVQAVVCRACSGRGFQRDVISQAVDQLFDSAFQPSGWRR